MATTSLPYGKFFIISLLFFFAQYAASAQTEELVERTVCFFDPINYSDDPAADEWVSTLVADTLEVMLRDEGYTVIEGQQRRKAAEAAGHVPDDFLDKDTALEFAASLGADVAATGVFRVEGQQIIIGVKAYDIFTRRIAVAVTKIGEAGIGIYDTVDEAALLIAGRVRENLKPLPADVITVQREKIKVEKRVVEEVVSVGKDVKVVFYSKDEGAELYLGGEKLIGTIEDGKLEYTGKANTSMDIVIKKEHYHDHTQSFTVEEEDAEFDLERLYWKTKWDIGTQVMINQPLGLNVTFRYHFIPDWLALYTRVGAYYLPPTYMPNQTVIPEGFSILGDVTAGIGGYAFTPLRWPFRVYLHLAVRGEYNWSSNYEFPGVLSFSVLGGGWFFEMNLPRLIFYAGFEGYAPFGWSWALDKGLISDGFYIDHDYFYLYLGVTWKR